MAKGVAACASAKGARGCPSAKGWKAGCVTCLSSFTCPSGLASTYNVSCPGTITWGVCANPTACSPSSSSAALDLDAFTTCKWHYNAGLGSSPCVAGWRTTNVGNFSGIKIDKALIGGCYYWIVVFEFGNFFTGISQQVQYKKLYLGGTDTPVGTYTLDLISVNGVACAGATADATVAVSP